MNFSSGTYLPNVAMHAAFLSILAAGLLTVMRQPGRRSFVAIAGLLATGVLPWFTALVPERRVDSPIADLHPPQVSLTLPTWNVVVLPLPQNKEVMARSEPVAAPTRFVFPDPVEMMVSVWATGTGAGMILLAGALSRVVFWRRSLLPVDDSVWKMIDAVATDLPDRGRFRLSETTTSPCVTGILRPLVVIPKFLLGQETEQQLRWAVGHELAHLRAGDSRWMIVFSLIRCVNWWNPFVHRLVSRWADAREQLCDLHATGLSEDRSDYGKFLVAMARRITGRPPLAVAMAKRAHANRLKQRILFLLESRADFTKPLGKGFISTCSGLIFMAAALVSILKIQAEVPRSSPDMADESESIPEYSNTTEDAADSPFELPELPIQWATPDFPSIPPDPAFAPRNCRQIKVASEFIVTGPESNFHEKSLKDGERLSIESQLSEGQVQMIVRGVKQGPSNIVAVAPSICMRSGQAATIEIIREVLGNPRQIAARGPKGESPLVGIRINVNGRFADEISAADPDPDGTPKSVETDSSVELEQTVEYRFVPGVHQPLRDLGAQPPEGLNPNDIKTLKRTIRSRVLPNLTVASALGEIEPGKFVTVLTKVVPIDLTGRPLDPVLYQKWMAEEDLRKRKHAATDPAVRARAERLYQEHLASMEAGVIFPSRKNRGSLRLTGTVVDIPLESDRAPGVVGLNPVTAGTAESILSSPGATIRQLGSVEMRLNELATPWPEFPDLSFSGVVSRDLKFIAVAAHPAGKTADAWGIRNGGFLNVVMGAKGSGFERRILIKAEAKLLEDEGYPAENPRTR